MGDTEEKEVRDFPFDEAVAGAQDWIKQGFTIHQKFTCCSCKQRLTIAIPDQFFTSGTCDKCGAITNIRLQGCNYMAIRLM